MDFMNLNQSAHGDREFGFMVTRLKIPRKVVVGHWKDEEVHYKMRTWMNTAVGALESRKIKVARFGDNMRNVAVTEGDKIEAQIRFGWSVDYYGIGDLVNRIKEVNEKKTDELFEEYMTIYDMGEEATRPGPIQEAIKEQIKIELALKSFLQEYNYTAFTTNFEDLHGMKQLPGLAVQRLMSEGYGFAGEGDWKTASLLRLMKIMANNKDTTFIEDYTYHLEPENEMILGSHMLEVCPTIAANKPKVVVKPLIIGGKEDPARLVFDGKAGNGIVVSIIDLGGRFRMIINEIEAIQPMFETPNLPVSKMLWKPKPSLRQAAEAWIYAGGGHHIVLSLALTKEQLYDLADIFNIECILIDQSLDMIAIRNQLKSNEILWKTQ